MRLRFDGEIWYWRGPSPFHFVSVPGPEAERLHEASTYVTYGWGMIPVSARIGRTTWTTSLFPKDGGYLMPIKKSIRQAENVDDGDVVSITLEVDSPG